MNTFKSDTVIDNTLAARRLSAKVAIEWFTSAYTQFKAFPFIWITLALIYAFMGLFALLHPILSFLSFLILPIVNGGLFIAANNGDNQQTPHIEDLIIRDKSVILKLVISGIVWGVISIVFSDGFITLALAGFSVPEVTADNLAQHLNSLSLLTLGMLVFLLIGFSFLSIAYTLTPGLIIYNRLSPLTAWRFAINACLQNWRATLFYLFILSVLGMLASIPFFLGWIILLPVMILTHFYLWKSFFGESNLNRSK